MPKAKAKRAPAPAEPVEDEQMADAPAPARGQLQAPEEDTMPDAPVVDLEAEDDVPTEADEEEPMRVRLLPGSTATAASFEILHEGHTLGNALRYIIMKNPDVEFCAYAIPHPSEPKMNVRIQTYEGTTAVQALEKGLQDLQDLCDVVEEKFVAARDKFGGHEDSD